MTGNEERENRATARKWLAQAEHDLAMAERNLAIDGFDVACFLAQQAVEKLLKAILIRETGKSERSHALLDLARAVAVPDGIRDALADLGADYMMCRYPDLSPHPPFETYDLPTARSRIDDARRVFRTLEARIDFRGDPDGPA